MQSLKALCRDMLDDPSFQALFEKECHVCTNTMRIFSRLHIQGSSPAQLARALKVDPAAVENLAEAEYCDPRLVVRLCRHLDLPAPENCPRLNPEKD